MYIKDCAHCALPTLNGGILASSPPLSPIETFTLILFFKYGHASFQSSPVGSI